MAEQYAAPSVVVGVDGSRAGVRAARWAVDEAIGRDLPLTLVAAADGAGATAAAEAALSAAAAAVAADGRLVRVHSTVVAGSPTPVLLDASARAEMLCIGAIGLKHFDEARIGSTAAALVAAAHCPVAVVRGDGRAAPATPGWVVVEIHQGADSAAVLQYAVEEARMRKAPLRVLGTWQSAEHDSGSVADADRVVRAQLDRNLENWRHRYPDLDVAPVAVHGSGLAYLAENAGTIQLIVVGAGDPGAVAELLGSDGLAALNNTECSLLVVDRQRLL